MRKCKREGGFALQAAAIALSYPLRSLTIEIEGSRSPQRCKDYPRFRLVSRVRVRKAISEASHS
jgi:hypothetical protein